MQDIITRKLDQRLKYGHFLEDANSSKGRAQQTASQKLASKYSKLGVVLEYTSLVLNVFHGKAGELICDVHPHSDCCLDLFLFLIIFINDLSEIGNLLQICQKNEICCYRSHKCDQCEYASSSGNFMKKHKKTHRVDKSAIS